MSLLLLGHVLLTAKRAAWTGSMRDVERLLARAYPYDYRGARPVSPSWAEVSRPDVYHRWQQHQADMRRRREARARQERIERAAVLQAQQEAKRRVETCIATSQQERWQKQPSGAVMGTLAGAEPPWMLYTEGWHPSELDEFAA